MKYSKDYKAIRSTRRVIILLLWSILLGCSVPRQAMGQKMKLDLEKYKKMTDYFVSKNYNENFTKYLIYDWDAMREKDSLFLAFMVSENIKTVYSYGGIKAPNGLFKDSVIEYHFMYTPLFGKRKKLVFDLSSTKETKGFTKSKGKNVAGEGIHYIKY